MRKRAREAKPRVIVLRPGDPGYNAALDHAIREPLFDAVITKLPFTPPWELPKLVDGLEEELRRRLREGK